VLSTGLATAILVGTISPQAAQATPDKQKDCTICHGEGAAPGFMQPAAQETYTSCSRSP